MLDISFQHHLLASDHPDNADPCQASTDSIQATVVSTGSTVSVVGAPVQRGAIEQLARHAVSEELAFLLATTDVQAGMHLVNCMRAGSRLHVQSLV